MLTHHQRKALKFIRDNGKGGDPRSSWSGTVTSSRIPAEFKNGVLKDLQALDLLSWSPKGWRLTTAGKDLCGTWL